MTKELRDMNPSIVLHDDGVVDVELWYPRLAGQYHTVKVGLVDVRAADSVQVSYDFERDGWVIKQASRFSWAAGEEPDEDWQEVAFVEAWARKQPGPGDDEYNPT